MNRKKWFFSLFLLSLILLLPSTQEAQETQVAQEGDGRSPAGRLSYAEGSGFQLVNAKGNREYDLSIDLVEGMEFYPGDYINTYGGTFIEVQLHEARQALKISENTSFRFSPQPEKREKQFEITFGRVRTRIGKLTGLERFAISGPGVVAGVRGTDFGYDVLYQDRDASPVTSVYCFEGQIELTPTVAIARSRGLEKGEEEGLQRGAPVSVLIGAGEMVLLQEGFDKTGEDEGAEARGDDGEGGFFLEKRALTEEIRLFWEVNAFRDEKLSRKVLSRGEKEELEETERIAPVVFTRNQLLRGSALSAGIGSVFGLAALTFLYADPLFEHMEGDTRDNLTLGMGVAGGLFFSTSFFTLLAALF